MLLEILFNKHTFANSLLFVPLFRLEMDFSGMFVTLSEKECISKTKEAYFGHLRQLSAIKWQQIELNRQLATVEDEKERIELELKKGMLTMELCFHEHGIAQTGQVFNRHQVYPIATF